jgi:hypothetical protein
MKPLNTISFILCLMASSLLSSCIISYGRGINGSRQIINKEIPIDGYDEIHLSLQAEVIYRHIAQDSPFLQISTDDNILPHLRLQTQGNRLILRSESGVNLRPSRLVIYTNSQSLSRIAIAGSGSIALEGAVNAKHLQLSIAGSGAMKTDSLYCETLQISISGSGYARLNGAATTARYDIAGSGMIRSDNYLVEYLTCNVSGSGSIHAWADKLLDANVSGSGSIQYRGAPTSISKNVSGSGNIQSRQ